METTNKAAANCKALGRLTGCRARGTGTLLGREIGIERSFAHWCAYEKGVPHRGELERALAEAVQEERTVRGLSVEEMAKLCQVSPKVMHRLLSGDVKWIATMEKVADALEMDLQEILCKTTK